MPGLRHPSRLAPLAFVLALASSTFHWPLTAGDPGQLSPSRLFFTNHPGDRVWQLPETMTDNHERPLPVPQWSIQRLDPGAN